MSKHGEPPPGAPSPAGTRWIGQGLSDDLAACALDLTRRFGDGATMWCVAPLWAEHARHLAVEFVHPVIVGKRALPAVSIDATDPVGTLRALASRGDVLVLIGDAATKPASPLLLPRIGVGADDDMDRRRRATAGRFGRSRPVARWRRRWDGTT